MVSCCKTRLQGATAGVLATVIESCARMRQLLKGAVASGTMRAGIVRMDLRNSLCAPQTENRPPASSCIDAEPLGLEERELAADAAARGETPGLEGVGVAVLDLQARDFGGEKPGRNRDFIKQTREETGQPGGSRVFSGLGDT